MRIAGSGEVTFPVGRDNHGAGIWPESSEFNILARCIIRLGQAYSGTGVMNRGDRREPIFKVSKIRTSHTNRNSTEVANEL